MPLTHHPSAQALANLLIGDCSPGAALLITRHLEDCAQCTARVRAMGAVGAPPAATDYGPTEILSPGVEVVRLRGVSGLGEAVFELQAAPGQAISVHESCPIAEILVLQGALVIDGETFGPGDFVSLEEAPAAALVSDAALGCRCLITSLDADGAPAV